MWSFQYKHGDKPLEGYTIERAAGRGGFGEVYYAVSDAGREVALKVVTGYEQIELRGISQCMNLKSPHLVTIFDVKHNAQGRPFVIMEFVSGPSLRQLIDENPSGLGQQKAAFFLREIGKGLTYLHECGIVHRDLKPGNIFYENGYVKIGDYGLSKAISTTQHSGQTVTVGTVHYMAPEIGAGKYDRSIDIYALGAVLYEMLTGVPPYVGASPSEVLLKHLSATPDCSGIAEPFATVINKAMAKDPAQRYQSVQEMVEAIFGAEHVRQSVSVFAPEELSVVAGRVAQHVGAGGGSGATGSAPRGQRPPPLPTGQEPTDPWQRLAYRFERAGDRIATRAQEAANRFEDRLHRRFGQQAGATPGAAQPSPEASRDMTVPIDDPLPRRARICLGLITVGVVSVAAAILQHQPDPPLIAMYVACAALSAVVGLFAMRYRLFPQVHQETRGMQRLLLGGAAAAGVLIVSALLGGDRQLRELVFNGTWAAITVPLFLLNISSWLNPNRTERIRLGSVIAAAALGFVVCQIAHGSSVIAMAVLAGIALATQAMAPWSSRMAAVQQTRPGGGQSAAPMGFDGDLKVNPGQAEQVRGDRPTTSSPPRPFPQTVLAPLGTVPPAIRVAWAIAMALLFSLGIAMYVLAGNSRHTRDLIAGVSTGSAAMLLALLAFARMLASRYFGLWNYLIRPLLMYASVFLIITVGMTLGNSNPRPEELAIAVFLIVFSSIALITVLFIPGKRYKTITTPATEPAATVMPHDAPPGAAYTDHIVGPISPHKRLWALVMALLGFLPIAGIHRLYVGKIGTGILWLITGGGFYIGTILDIISICNGTFTDKQGRKLVIWEDWNELGEQTRLRAVTSLSASALPTARGGGSHASGLLSALAGLFLFVATVLGIGLALNLPAGIAANVFTEPFARDVQQQAFNGFANWPELAYRMGFVTEAMLLLTAIGVLLFARRRAGAAHIVRAFLAVSVLSLSMLVLQQSFHSWDGIAPLVADDNFPAAINEFLAHFSVDRAIAAMVLFLGAKVLFVWPAGTRTAKRLDQPELGQAEASTRAPAPLTAAGKAE